VVAAVLGVFMMVTPLSGAEASTGSIPPAVTEFAAADDGLVLTLEEYFGVNQSGTGLDFSEGTEFGSIDRVFLWSEVYRSGEGTETPVQYVNRWQVPVLIGEEPVGVALIGIDPATVEPEMIDFIRSPGTALALDDIDTDATLVHEPETNAWFSLVDDTITPLVRGTSDVAGSMTLADYQPMLSNREVGPIEQTPQPDQGAVQSVVVIAATAVMLLLVLLIPTLISKARERREARSEESAGDAPAAVDEGDGEMLADEPAAGDAVPQAHPANVKGVDDNAVDDNAVDDNPVEGSPSAAPTATASKTALKKPAAKKSAAKKPAVQKSAVQKPAVQKPAAKKPAAKKPTGAPATTKAAPKKPAATTKAKTPTTKKPAATKPAAKSPAAKSPSKRSAASKTEKSAD